MEGPVYEDQESRAVGEIRKGKYIKFKTPDTSLEWGRDPFAKTLMRRFEAAFNLPFYKEFSQPKPFNPRQYQVVPKGKLPVKPKKT